MGPPKDRTVQETREMIILGKYLPVLCPELQVWIKEINPTSVAEAANLPDVFVVAQKKGKGLEFHDSENKGQPEISSAKTSCKCE